MSRFRSGRVKGDGFREPAFAGRSLHRAKTLVRASAGEGRNGADVRVREYIEAERAELQAMLRRGDINDHTARKLFTEFTFSEAVLKGREQRD
ncbi:hypothetical protein EN873_43000 [bacterium M00.F.Ca.ET.230.01.1.1]|nr:hypothetical protein EN873_43000 [bacterium M00.F.Ca.ET.230.01.1.1]